MPAYAYRCRECGEDFDVRRAMTDEPAPPPACPRGHGATTRVFSAVAVGGRAGGAPAPAAAGGGCCGGGCCG